MASLRQSIPHDFSAILIGNKTDLTGDREVAMEKGANYAEAQNFYFMETSAKMDLNVTEACDIVIKKCAKDFFSKMEQEET